MENQLEEMGLELMVPANENWLLVIRMALMGTGALLGLTVDMLDDLRSLADEACDCLLHQRRKMKTLKVYCYKENCFVHTVFSGERGEQEQDVAQPDVQIVNCILETLSIATKIEKDEHGVWKIEVVLPIEEQ